MITVINEQRESRLPHASANGDSLWLNRSEIEQTVAWTWKPEGLCQGDICMPLPPAKATEMVQNDRLDVAAMWRYMGNPVVHDSTSNTWVLGTGAVQRGQALSSLEALDFELPDLSGQMHHLSDYRGKKVLLVTWASW